ncbi:hypothetical protein BDN70DRAFT_870684 [Pholiota conissans]|uniref:Uncharacterized protein n=1 Tax=Pholiota conissans TaxID=109636 RepID=A0A9P6D006_9AGAR|nr:hypothetical protein BDN70DRAFT_870684 [Pholiota conissans]
MMYTDAYFASLPRTASGDESMTAQTNAREACLLIIFLNLLISIKVWIHSMRDVAGL